MGNESDLWDDSALTNAFNNAIAKYKAMHRKEHHVGSTDVEEMKGDNPETEVDENHSDSRIARPDDSNNVVVGSAANDTKTNDVLLVQENHQGVSTNPEPLGDTSSSDIKQPAEGYTNSQGELEYNQLLSQYYELEEQRQKVLQQLYQFGSGYYQTQDNSSGSCPSSAPYSTTQANQDPTHYASQEAVVSSCCPYVCPCLSGLCTSVLACSSGGACLSKVDTCSACIACASAPGYLSTTQDDPIVKTAMGAAERAIASIKMETSCTSNIQEEKDKMTSSKSAEGALPQTSNSETDLTSVFNAWYSAGFYTGKYLSEQAIAKRQNE